MKIMYTHSNAYERKLSTSTLLTLLVVSAIITLVPIGVVHGIAGGAPKLGVLSQTGSDAAPTITAATVATGFVNGTAGNIGAKTDPASGSVSGNLTVFFSVGGIDLVTFSGAQFNLMLSKDGFSLLSPSDIKYAGPFLVSALATPLIGTVEPNGTYYVGTTNVLGVCTPGCKVVEGPLPINFAAGYKFIKVWDGSSVAALQFITIAAGIRIVPTSGPADRPVQVLGGGFTPNTLIDLNYSYTFRSWPTGGASVKSGQWQTSVSTTSNGYFSNLYNMLDTKQAVNPTGGPFNDVITITAVKHTYPHTLLANIAPATPATYTESSRVFTQVISFKQSGALVVNSTAGTYYGNDTGIAPIIPQPVDVYARGMLWIAGNFWSWGGSVTFWVSNGTSTGFNPFNSTSTTTAGSTPTNQGTFGLNLTIPDNLPIGIHTVKVVSNGVYYTFQVYMNPTLILSPNYGTASNPDTQVWAYAYGFPANIKVLLYWEEISLGDGNEYNLANGTTGANGRFNVTVTFWVPETYGGDHWVTVWDFATQDFTDYGNTYAVVPKGPPCDEASESFCEEMDDDGVFPIADEYFTVTPSFVVIPGSFNSTFGGNVMALGEGLNPETVYSVNIDNQQTDFSTFSAAWHGLVRPANNGLLNLTFIGAGFRPGLHVISLTSDDASISAGSYGPETYAFFTVTTAGDSIADMLSSMTATLNSMTATLNSINTAIAALPGDITASTSTITAAISASTSTITAAISASTSTITAAITSAQNAISSDISASTAAITAAITSAQSATATTLSGISDKVNTISSAVSGVSGVGNTATSILSAVQAEQTYVLVVAVLAAITLVLVLAVLIRKLS